MPVPKRERQQQQRPALGVIGDDDEGREVLARSDLPLPGLEEIEALIGRGELPLSFEAAPDRLGLAEIAGRYRRWRCGSLSTTLSLPPFGFRSRQPWSLRNLSTGNYLHFSASADLCKEMSTKSNDNAAERGEPGRSREKSLRAIATGNGNAGDRRCHPTIRFLTSLRLELAYFSGLPWLRGRRAGGAGVILRFERVRPRRRGAFSAAEIPRNHARDFSIGRSGR